MALRHGYADEKRSADSPTTDDVQELAEIERLLRADERTQGVEVHAGDNGARIYFDTWEPNPHSRGSLTADVCLELAATASWGLSNVHDPTEDPNGQGVVSTALTAVHAPEDGVHADHGDGLQDRDYVDVETAETCVGALAQDVEHDNLPAAQLDARDLLDALTPGVEDR